MYLNCITLCSSLSVSKGGGCKKGGGRLFSRACDDRTRRNGFKLKVGRFRLNIGKVFFCNQGGKALARVAQRAGGHPIPGDIQEQAGWGSGHLTCCGCPYPLQWGWIGWSLRVSFKLNDSFYDSAYNKRRFLCKLTDKHYG